MKAAGPVKKKNQNKEEFCFTIVFTYFATEMKYDTLFLYYPKY